jgi:hypothetical protein
VCADLLERSLRELAGLLRDLHTLRTPIGWPTESAVTKSSVERRIFDLVARQPSPLGHDEAGDRIGCELAVKLRRSGKPSVTAPGAELRVGGLFLSPVGNPPLEIGERVELEVMTETRFRLRAHGTVDWLAHGGEGRPAGAGIGFQSMVGEAAERRIERLIQELLRNRVEH